MNIKNKILSWLIGKKHQEESKILNQWKVETKNNIKKLVNHVNTDVYIDNLKDYKEVDKAKGWHQIQSKTKANAANVSGISVRKIAAVLVVLIVSLAGMWITMYQSSDPVEYVSQSEISEHTLNDGTAVALDRNSTLKMIRDRDLSLTGRCFFDVAKNPELPFRVSMHHGVLEVLGTQFVIFTTEDKTTVYVHEGQVKIQYNENSFVLSAKDKIVLNPNEIVTSKTPEINPKSWMTNQLVFKDESLSKVLNTLAVHYNVELMYEKDVLQKDNCKINSSFENISINEVLDELSLISGLEYRFSQNKVVILGFKC